jgi:hypothetical protein
VIGTGALALPPLELDANCYFGTAQVIIGRMDANSRPMCLVQIVECAVVPGSKRVTLTGARGGDTAKLGEAASNWLMKAAERGGFGGRIPSRFGEPEVG